MRIAVLGLGNMLLGDEGFGQYAIGELESRYDLPDEVETADLGTPGLDLVSILIDLEAVIFVNTVQSPGRAGELRVYGRRTILRQAHVAGVTKYDAELTRALQALRLAGEGPRDVTLVSVIPGRVSAPSGLSEGVRRAVPAAIAEIIRQLARLGVAVTPRKEPLQLPPWWHEPALTS